MTLPLEVSAFYLVLMVVLGTVLFGLLRALRHLIGLLGLSKTRRDRVERVLPVGEMLVALVYLLYAVPMVFDDHPQYSPIGLGLILLGFTWVSWFSIRDFINGVFLRSSRIVRQGDHVRIREGLSGRLTRLGYRTVAIITDDGNEAVIPYSQLARESIVRTPVVDGVCRHAFRVELPGAVPVSSSVAVIRRAALTHHWHSLAQPPLVELTDDGACAVTVFALEEHRGSEIEGQVRAVLSSGLPEA